MLSPGDRLLIYDAVQPPTGYELDHALITTYSLDLTALLAIPVALTFRDWHEDDDGTPAIDPVGLLEAVSENASKLTVACQAGEIAVPAFQRNLFAFMEESVVPVSAPRDGVFHPKAYVLRYVTDDGPVRYRFLCASRNLTHDRSWDVMLALDGTVRGREQRARASSGAAAFVDGVRRLIEESPVAPQPERLRKLEQLGREVGRTDFELPDGFEDLRFHPLGLNGGKDPDPFEGRRDRLLVISPFVSAPRLRALVTDGGDVLIGSQSELDALPSNPAGEAREVFVLDPATEEEPLDPEAEATDAQDDRLTEQGLSGSADGLLRGLHAKVYVADSGWKARVWVGSANATSAAFERNVELLVELTGKKGKAGINTLLGTGDGGLRSLLQPYRRNEDGKPDPDVEAAERLVDRGAHALGAAGITLRVGDDPEGKLAIEVRPPAGLADALGELDARTWPVTLNPDRAQDLDDLHACRWQGLAPQQVSAFLGVELTGTVGAAEVTRRVSLRCRLEGAPDDRVGAVIRSILDSPEKLLRYLAFLLADIGGDPASAVGMIELLSSEPGPTEPGDAAPGFPEFPLFESLVKALARDPARIDRVGRLLAEIRRAPNAEELLPEGFEAVWEPVVQARRELART